MPGFLLRRANYRALAGDPGAGDDVNRVLAEPKWNAQHKSADSLLKWMAARRASGEAAIYTALIPGNRLTAERKWDEAAAAYEPVRRDHPGDTAGALPSRRPAVRPRRRRRRAGAAATALAADKAAPAWIKAQSLLIVARAEDLAGRRDAATRDYRRVVDDYEHENAVWAARVGLITPYRRK